MGLIPKSLREKMKKRKSAKKSKDEQRLLPGQQPPGTPQTVSEETPSPQRKSAASKSSRVGVATKRAASTSQIPTQQPAQTSAPIIKAKSLLGELNVIEDDDDGTELILGPLPTSTGATKSSVVTPTNNEGDKEAGAAAASPRKMPVALDGEDGTELLLDENKDASKAPMYADKAVSKEETSQQVDPEGKSADEPHIIPNDEANDDDFPEDEKPSNKSPPRSLGATTPLWKTLSGYATGEQPQKEDPPASKPDPDGDTGMTAGESKTHSEVWKDATETARKLVDAFNCVDESACNPGDLRKKVVDPALDSCQPMDFGSGNRGIKRTHSDYNSPFAAEFLDEILNVGYALVYQEPKSDGDWSGRSATLILRPGTCNATQSIQPCLEWTTMAGGTQTTVHTKRISLLKLHSLASSNLSDDEKSALDDDDSENNDEEELQCLFTVTTTDGVVEVFEAITPQEADRLVRGIKNISARFVAQLIAGDTRAFTEFYTQNGESDAIKLPIQEAMARISNEFFDL